MLYQLILFNIHAAEEKIHNDTIFTWKRLVPQKFGAVQLCLI